MDEEVSLDSDGKLVEAKLKTKTDVYNNLVNERGFHLPNEKEKCMNSDNLVGIWKE
jgi:hypothetical protein